MNGKQLRASILQEAIVGRLVPQDPNDEPASELLHRINPKATPLETDQPLPEGWCATTLSDICTTINGLWKGKKGPFVNVGVIRNANFTKDFKLDYSKIQYLDVEQKSFAKRKLLDGDLIVEKSGGGDKTPVGRAILYEGENGIYSFSNFTMLLRIRDKAEILPKYIYYFLLAKHRSGAMVGMQTHTTGLRNLETDKYLSMPVPLPPLAEQKHIIAKIEELMPLVDEYEKAQEEFDNLNAGLKNKLRASLLQEAIAGRLVPQDPNDEPASELLKRIAPKATPIQDDVPYEIPDSWAWCRLSSLCISLTDGTHSTPKYTTSGVPFVSVKDMSSGTLDLSNTKYISREDHEILAKRCNPQKGDILLSKVGTTGVPTLVTTEEEFSLFVSVALIKFNPEEIDKNFFVYLLKSPLVQEQAKSNTRGVGNKNWVLSAIANTLVVLPPLAEQKRIVEKLESMFAVLDNLDACGD